MEFIGIRTSIVYFSKNGRREHVFTCNSDDEEEAIKEALFEGSGEIKRITLKPAFRATATPPSKKRKGELVTAVLENGIKITYREGDPGSSKISIA